MHVHSQEIKLLDGQITADSSEVANIHVVNVNLETGTTSNARGEFKINARLGDTLFFSSVQFNNRKLFIKQSLFQEGKFTVKLYPSRNELDEVKITDFKISGHLDTDLPKISYFDREKYRIPYPEKKLSQTERRLYTANANITSRWQYIGVLLGGVPLDVIMNDINGRTKKLRNRLEREKMQEQVQYGIDVLPEDFFLNELALPELEIGNFVFYCARYPEFSEIIKSSTTLDLIDFYKSKREEFINLREINASNY